MRKTPIWNYFVLKTEPHGKFAVCKYQNLTSSLQYHVKSKHKDKLKDLPIQKAQKHRLEDDDSAIVTYASWRELIFHREKLKKLLLA